MTPSSMRDFLDAGRSFLGPDVVRLYLRGRRSAPVDVGEHLAAAVSWLCRAQDTTGSGGVARGYSLAWNRRIGRAGWQPAYPETTGYIIPTVFDCARLFGSQELFDRGVRMADWECDVQMESGAVQGGTVDLAPSPAIFNTGQVIFGWVRAWEETGNARFLDSAVRAGSFLLEQQDADGAWRRNLSRFASPSMPSYTYNTRSAWALNRLAFASGDRRFAEAAVRNVEYALTQQAENGYYWNNCLDVSEQALSHTIAYCLRGILEVGVLADEPRFLGSVVLAARPLLAAVRDDGSLPGRFRPDWSSAASWSCLTGNSQIALVFGRLYQTVGGSEYLEGMRRLNTFQRRMQILDALRPDLHGGVCGAHPVHGPYGQFEIVSWAVKFFLDALMVEIEIVENRTLLLDLLGPAAFSRPRSAQSARRT